MRYTEAIGIVLRLEAPPSKTVDLAIRLPSSNVKVCWADALLSCSVDRDAQPLFAPLPHEPKKFKFESRSASPTAAKPELIKWAALITVIGIAPSIATRFIREHGIWMHSTSYAASSATIGAAAKPTVGAIAIAMSDLWRYFRVFFVSKIRLC